jgi:LemA protein
MKKGILGILIVMALYGISTYNGLVSGRSGVDQAWANVQTQYQRRVDLIPQLVSTVQGAANFEKSTLTAVIEARRQVMEVNIDPANPESIEAFKNAQSVLGNGISRLLATAEAYPQIQANQNFRDLQSQLEGTENRIAVSRDDFNAAA